ncbi:hypothetical protein [Nocardioides convexus]|uniref:hypothetical protein n=1 Tax=Nocardioides convexus TaxID=2712224 RepID=UPI0024184616|nr:hypothetical protein [Nocardioides convexus]
MQDENAREAQKIANVTVSQFADYIQNLEQVTGSDNTVLVKKTDEATYNPSQVSPTVLLNLVVAALIGLLLGIGLAVTREPARPHDPHRGPRRRVSPTPRSWPASASTTTSARRRCSPTWAASPHAPRPSACCARTCSSSTSTTSRAASSSAAQCRARARR